MIYALGWRNTQQKTPTRREDAREKGVSSTLLLRYHRARYQHLAHQTFDTLPARQVKTLRRPNESHIQTRRATPHRETLSFRFRQTVIQLGNERPRNRISTTPRQRREQVRATRLLNPSFMACTCSGLGLDRFVLSLSTSSRAVCCSVQLPPSRPSLEDADRDLDFLMTRSARPRMCRAVPRCRAQPWRSGLGVGGIGLAIGDGVVYRSRSGRFAAGSDAPFRGERRRRHCEACEGQYLSWALVCMREVALSKRRPSLGSGQLGDGGRPYSFY